MQTKLSIAECDRIITAPGATLEMEERLINGRKVRTWKNLPDTFRQFLLHSFESYSSRIFLSAPSRGRAITREYKTYDEVLNQSLRLAVWMKGRGLCIGSKVAIGGGNCTGWIVAFVATQLIGGISVCLNAWLPVPDIIHCLALTKPDLVLLDEVRWLSLSQQAAELSTKGIGQLFCWSSDHRVPRCHTLEQMGKAASSGIEAVLNGTNVTGLGPESDAVIFFTSGTGGAPKAVLSTNRMALTNIFSGLVAPARAALRAGLKIPPLPSLSDPQKTVLLSIPLFHVTGCLSWLMRAFFAGSKVVMMRKWGVSEAIRLIELEKVTVIGGVPAVVSSILQSPDLPKDRSFETVFYGGAAASKELAKEVKIRWPNAGLVQGYGMTETNAYVCSVAGADYLQRPDSTGPPVPVCDIRIVDPDKHTDLRVGQVGLLLVKGPQIMKYYYANPVATREVVDEEGWLDTGDVGVLGPSHFMTFGRGSVFVADSQPVKDIIIRGGENIPSSDIENALYANPAILEAAAIGLPDPILGEVVGAVVTLRPSYINKVDEATILSEVKTRLGRRAWPAMIWIREEELPRNVNGKIVKRDLKVQMTLLWNARVNRPIIRSRL